MANDAQNYQALAYELPEIWEDAWFTEADHERLRCSVQLVPALARTLLDVGCGNGLFLRALAADRTRTFDRLAGLDRSEAALAHLPTEKYAAPIDALPFSAREFEIVTCMEVLEHLSVDSYPRALDELSRVAGQHLLITVPYRQDLEASLSKCPQCHARFNPDFHVRSFDEDVLRDLFATRGFQQVSCTRLGETVLYLDQVIRQRLNALRQPRQVLSPYGICPVCGFHDAALLRAALERRRAEAAVATAPPQPSRLRRLLAPMIPVQRRYRWACALYRRSTRSGP